MGKLVLRRPDGSRVTPKPKLADRAPPFTIVGEAGYAVLHPTKGFRIYRNARVNASNLTTAKRQGILPWWTGIKPLMEKVNA